MLLLTTLLLAWQSGSEVPRKSSENDRLLVDREELARLCAKGESTIRLWLRQGIIERANPAAPRDQKALFDLAVCLPRILSYVGEKRELTPEERAYAAARLRVMETRAKQAELEYAEASGRLHTTASVLGIVGPMHIAFRQKMLGLPTKTARALATMTDPVEIQKMLTGEVREALGKLRGFQQKYVAARRRQRVKGNGVGREVEACG